MYSQELLVKNLLVCYQLTTNTQREAGLAWYAEAQEFAKDLSVKFDIPFETICGVIAATSPMQQWSTQLKFIPVVLAEYKAFGTATPPGFGANAKKSLAILDGGAPLDILKGDKVRQFHLNLIGVYDGATIDRWMYRAATGRPLTDKEINPLSNYYSTFAEACRVAAETVGQQIAHFQAIVWIFIRKLTTDAYNVVFEGGLTDGAGI